MKKIKVGMVGLGTVGSGVFKVLQDFDNIELKKIVVKNLSKKRNIDGLNKNLLTDNPEEITQDKDIDIIVEVIGGIEPAFSIIKKAILNGKHVVTANKELLAKHGQELFNFAQENNKVILYEAAIGGGIPIIMPIKTILRGNKIKKIAAILNGTTNYILTKMDTEKASYADVLKEAQELGYAEGDPTGDVEGFDSAYKVTTLSTIAFGQRVDFKNVYREGITKITAEDMVAANELGYKIKLIALAQLDENNRADVRVHPMLVSKKSTLAHINYVTNAVMIDGYPMGEIVLSGSGAGEFPTASSVVGDILAITSEIGTTDYLLPMMRCNHSKNAEMINYLDTYNKYYMSLNVNNNTGVIATIGSICAENGISLSSILQKGLQNNNTADITIVTEKVKEANLQNMIEKLKQNGYKVNSLIRVLEN